MEFKTISRLPENPMLAFPYVEFQQWTDDLYDLQKGLAVGTIFPRLNQPVSLYEWGEGGCFEQK